MIHPYEVQEMTLDEAALTLKVKSSDALRKRIAGGNYPGMFYKVGDEWRTSLHLIYEGQKRLAAEHSADS
jgi:hypothetical protein